MYIFDHVTCIMYSRYMRSLGALGLGGNFHG